MAIRDLKALEGNLTKNALAFLRRAIFQMNSAAEDGDDQQLAFAVVDLAVATEVLIKARLLREHWTLILADVNKAKLAELLSGSARTITHEQAVSRLEQIAGVSLTGSNFAHEQAIKQIFQLRNRAAHFTLGHEATDGIRTQMGLGLNFLLWFLDEEFKTVNELEVNHEIEYLMADVSRELAKIKELTSARLKTIKPRLRSAPALAQCPVCHQETLILGDGMAECPFCRNPWLDGDDIASEYVAEVLELSAYRTVKDGGIWPIHECPECARMALVEGVFQHRSSYRAPKAPEALRCDWEGQYYWVCFSCGLLEYKGDLMSCYRCGDVARNDICSGCADYQMEND